MGLIAKSIKGTQDLLPQNSYKTQYVEQAMREIAHAYGYHEVRTPVFEQTDLFERGVGGTTDVVQKEMYTFTDKGGNSLTLRPEGTAGAARAFLEHGLFNEPLPQKMYYFTSCYRHENPQAGRLREFHQFGIECFGTASPAADAEAIALARSVFDYLGVTGLSIEINSIGCPECRKNYLAALRKYFSSHVDELCETCRGRLERNPMRILDCKSPACAAIAKGAPTCIEYLCEDCREHFGKVKDYLDVLEIDYAVNPRIVRGLDYYTRTVFEFVSGQIGAQGTVCGGGRYDGLMEELGSDRHYPSLGFGLGIERLLLVMEAQGIPFPEPPGCDLFIGSIGEDALKKAMALADAMRADGVSVEYDVLGRSVKAQMKYANKLGASYTMVLGEEEIRKDTAVLKNMGDGSTQEVSLSAIGDEFMSVLMNDSLQSLENAAQNFDLGTADGGIGSILEGKNNG